MCQPQALYIPREQTRSNPQVELTPYRQLLVGSCHIAAALVRDPAETAVTNSSSSSSSISALTSSQGRQATDNMQNSTRPQSMFRSSAGGAHAVEHSSVSLSHLAKTGRSKLRPPASLSSPPKRATRAAIHKQVKLGLILPCNS